MIRKLDPADYKQPLYEKRSNPHPRGMIGELMANTLIRYGWYEQTIGLDSNMWTSPEGTVHGKIEWAHDELMRRVHAQKNGESNE